jgi:hypothetical protein
LNFRPKKTAKNRIFLSPPGDGENLDMEVEKMARLKPKQARLSTCNPLHKSALGKAFRLIRMF